MKNSEEKNSQENSLAFVQRLLIYQKERFPFILNGIAISIFTLSAICYSLICRNQSEFIQIHDLIIGVVTNFVFFFFIRIFDEFKDHKEDIQFRKYLPVPRGLISLKELKLIGWTIGLVQLGLILIFQIEMLPLYLLIFGYLLLMRVEFFIPKWLKEHQIAYISSHMVIIPLIDLYASGLDWKLSGDTMHWGLVWFFILSLLNGFVLEFGRKIKTPKAEEIGVVSYSGLYGTKGASTVWLTTLFVTFGVCVGAVIYAKTGITEIIVLSTALIICSIPGILFFVNPTNKKAKFIEYSSVIWTILMYFSVGVLPWIKNLSL